MSKQQPYKTLYTEESKVDAKYMLDFILKNKDSLSEFRLHDLYVDTVTSKFKKDTEAYLSDRFENDILKFKAPTNWISYEELMKLWKDKIQSSGLTDTERQEKQIFEYLFNNEAYQWDSKSTFGRVDHLGVDGVINLLLYVLTGKLNSGRNSARDIWKEIVIENDIDTWMPVFSNVTHPDLRGLTLTRYKNGKMVIKGLSSKQAETISRLEELSGRSPHRVRKFYPKDKYPDL